MQVVVDRRGRPGEHAVEQRRDGARTRLSEGLAGKGREVRLEGRRAAVRRAASGRALRRRAAAEPRSRLFRGDRRATRAAGADGLWRELGRGHQFRRLPEQLPLLPAAAVQPLHEARVPRGLPGTRDLQARGRRHRAGRPGQVPGHAPVQPGVPVRQGVLQLYKEQVGEVHLLLPARGAGRGAGLRAAVSRPVALRRLPRGPGRADPQAGLRVEGRAAAAPGVRHRAERVLRAADPAAVFRLRRPLQ